MNAVDQSGPQPSLISLPGLVTPIVFTVVATIAVGLRIYAIRAIKTDKKLHSDTWLIILALVSPHSNCPESGLADQMAQLFCWGDIIQLICAVAIGGVTYAKLPPEDATRFFLKAYPPGLGLAFRTSNRLLDSMVQYIHRCWG